MDEASKLFSWLFSTTYANREKSWKSKKIDDNHEFFMINHDWSSSKLQNYFSEGFLSYVSFLKFLQNALFDKMRIEKVFLGIVINTELLIRQLFSNFLLKPYSSFWSAWRALSDDTNFNILYVHRKKIDFFKLIIWAPTELINVCYKFA